ncbi:MAG TPA: helix-turn-helix transcriptional regulator [Chitinophagaceae bacterium]|jgi:transcriptional regulator with XRE-family HTH domain|nr:helix-turn-helix transcriptional regulator [Chitinophagaceae bacterium]
MFTGENLRLLRTIKGIPQKTVAKKMGVSQVAVSKMEHLEKISVENFEKCLKAINCTREDAEKIKGLLPRPR